MQRNTCCFSRFSVTAVWEQNISPASDVHVFQQRSVLSQRNQDFAPNCTNQDYEQRISRFKSYLHFFDSIHGHRVKYTHLKNLLATSFSSTEKKVAGNYKLQTAKHQVEKLQSSLHPNSDAFAAAGPLQPAPPPKKNPPPKAVLRRGRLSRSTKHKAEATHNFQKTDSVNLEKLLPLPIPEEALDRSFEMLGSDDW